MSGASPGDGLRATARAEEALAAPLPAPLPANPRPSPAGLEREFPFQPFYRFSPQKISCVQFVTPGINEYFLPTLCKVLDLLRIKGWGKKPDLPHQSSGKPRKGRLYSAPKDQIRIARADKAAQVQTP